eukprot:gb/GEZN01002149.1/.p1 GENE.gb/GEZN01002149.1/~~gb/GEZN01002149.1/.p1  ORF type:complete len:780 (+),score=83.75 gb/GEZN01002149.1/:34-2373(+)
MSKQGKRKGDANGPAEKKQKKETEYGWKQLHEDVEAGKYCGVYGSCHAPYHGLAALRQGVDLREFHKKRSPDEFYLPDLQAHIDKPATQSCWDEIFTLDPLGLYAHPPSMSATEFRMRIPELDTKLDRDGTIVLEDGRIAGSKVAIDYCWNLPKFAEKVKLDETAMRKTLCDYTQNPKLLDPLCKAFFPPVGGATIYMFGNIAKLGDPTTQVAVRVHDQCTGSDVFGTDICTCRPYLVFAIQAAAECAQKGGVGLIVYFQKEGRSLGEVTKYRVYNARLRQEGGDRPEMYFYQTESIAGIRDARFQEMMPDVLLWLGIKRIDWLLSMSSDKYDAITGAGIEVMQRVSLPDEFVPENATVEITAKIASGYHTDIINTEETLTDLRKLETIRLRCAKILELAQRDKTRHFKLHMDKLDGCVDFVFETMKKNYPTVEIPYHSRWRHFDQKRLSAMEDSWHCSKTEKARRRIDLVTVSVLLDAGSGAGWKYHDHGGSGQKIGRSEGLAIATQMMFQDGLFSSDVAMPHRVNAHGLASLTDKEFSKAFQHSDSNKLVGMRERLSLMRRLGKALSAHPEFFGHEIARPGHIADFVLKHVQDNHVHINTLWKAIIEGLESIWPENISGVRRGDVWTYSPMKVVGHPGSDMVPFHKLSQWLTYSLLEPLQDLGIIFDGMDLLTGLAEYRNGGLLVDFKVLTPRDDNAYKMTYDVGSELIIEWRALTLCLLDEVAKRIRSKINKTEREFPLAKVLQGGTWTAGRAIAAQLRPERGQAPITVDIRGNVF